MQITAPTAGEDSRELWQTVAKLAQANNALDCLVIITNASRNKLTVTEGNATLELKAGEAVNAGVLGPNYYNGAAHGVPCFYRLNGGGPLDQLPAGATTVNPP